MATEYQLTLLDYLSIMRRRAPYLVGIAGIVFVISVIVSFVIPPTYLATGTIMVESQQVPDNIVQSAIKNQIDERISIIKQRVMTRDSLLRIANKYSLFKDSSSTMTSSELIEAMRNRVNIELLSSDALSSNSRVQSTIAFTLSFEDKQREVAYQVANDLTTLFLDWNVKLRTEGATETTIFLTEEANKLRLEVERIEQQIAKYKQQNSNNLPEQLTLRMTMLARAEGDLREVVRDLQATKNELNSLGVELSAAKSGMGDDLPQTLPALKAEYAKLSATYNESHPDMKALKRKIDALEKEPKTSEAANVPENAPTLEIFKIEAQIASAISRQASLVNQKKALESKISENELAMVLTPKAAQGLDVLIRDRDSVQKKYEELRSKQITAQISESLENENKSERFILLEPPIMPEKAFKPNRVKIVALGFFLAIASSVGMLLMMASFDSKIRGVDALEHVLGQRPLVVIPYLIIQEEWSRKKRLLKLGIILTVCVVILVAIALYFLYML
ncbi:MAG: lipopolysaccharide biosynthesis protein [Candidatus Nitrotoga sp.]